MAENFPIPIPPRLPVCIDPCPIVESIFETRFTSAVPWATMPGMLFAQIRDRYPNQKSLPLSQMPDEWRKQDPTLAHLPLLQFLNNKFLVQVGPRLVSLATQPNAYPGWKAISTELAWLLERLKKAEIVSETERIGVRYIDFFPEDIFPRLLLAMRINEQPMAGAECDVSTVLHRGSMVIRLRVTNAAIVSLLGVPKKGSILDVDAWFGALNASVFEDGCERFDEAHRAIKELFFGLLRPEFLAMLNPVYE